MDLLNFIWTIWTNPFLNDVTFNVDARISVPSGIHVYGEGFGQAGVAGTIYGTFSIPPGKAKTIYINIKGDKTGFEAMVAITGLLAIYMRKKI